jgi:hypothetical protein
MLRCAASFVIAAYVKVRLTPHDLRALPAELFYEAVNNISNALSFFFGRCYRSTVLRKGAASWCADPKFTKHIIRRMQRCRKTKA